jgi:hypothetical protein
MIYAASWSKFPSRNCRRETPKSASGKTGSDYPSSRLDGSCCAKYINTLFFCIIWDVVVYRLAGSTATISRIMWDIVSGYPGLAIAIGALIGHFWFSQQGIAPAH